jgi:hypothetical protein
LDPLLTGTLGPVQFFREYQGVQTFYRQPFRWINNITQAACRSVHDHDESCTGGSWDSQYLLYPGSFATSLATLT